MPNAETLIQQLDDIQQTLALERVEVEVVVGDVVGERGAGVGGTGATVRTQVRDTAACGNQRVLRHNGKRATSYCGSMLRATMIQKLIVVCELRQRIAFITNNIVRTWRSRIDTDLLRGSCCVHNRVACPKFYL